MEDFSLKKISSVINLSKIKISELYLHIANKLPPKIEYIKYLQSINKSRIEEAKQTKKSTSIPSAYDIDLIGFRMFEAFHINDFNSIQSNLIDFIHKFRISKISGVRFNNRLENITGFYRGISWSRLGVLIPEGKEYLGADFKFATPLSKQIKSITLSIHRILPSLYLLTFDVFLEENVIKELLLIQNKLHKPEVELLKFFPVKNFIGHSMGSSRSILIKEVEKYLLDLRNSLCKDLRTLLVNGLFSESNENILPSIEIFTYSGKKDNHDNTIFSHSNNIFWLDSLCFDSFGGFFSNKEIFFQKTNLMKNTHRLAVNTNEFNINKKLYRGNQRFGYFHSLREFLDDVSPLIFLQEFNEKIIFDLEELRPEIFANIRNIFKPGASLSSKIKELKTKFDYLNDIEAIYSEFKADMDYQLKHLERGILLEKTRGLDVENKVTLNGYFKFQFQILETRLIPNLKTWLKTYELNVNLNNTRNIYLFELYGTFLAFLALIVALIPHGYLGLLVKQISTFYKLFLENIFLSK